MKKAIAASVSRHTTQKMQPLVIRSRRDRSDTHSALSANNTIRFAKQVNTVDVSAPRNSKASET